MFLFAKPSKTVIETFLLAAQEMEFSYIGIGATETTVPNGYLLDHNLIEIGESDAQWDAAKRSISTWRMFDIGWVNIYGPTTPIETGQAVAIVIRHLGFYSLNAARIVYTIDEPARFGFAYGTLEDHGESGEERFMVERDSEGKIWYDLKAFSRPDHIFSKIGYPVVRMLQKRFARDSKQAMFRAVNAIG
ncbi:MAG TPA: DUF1990 domain-containing protein [Pyrinomonadaceae bacterium]|nr:DUF1990 domain-containing protein [Pyrinomonadaceae bacterium]